MSFVVARSVATPSARSNQILADDEVQAPGVLVEKIERVVLVVHAPCPPTAEAWRQCIENLERSVPFDAILVISNGTTISATQRADVQRVVGAAKARVAVVADSRFTRGVVTALHWLGLQIRAFPTRDIDSALDYAGVRRTQRSNVEDVITNMDAAVRGVTLPRAGSRLHA
jgi:hypothetical protein